METIGENYVDEQPIQTRDGGSSFVKVSELPKLGGAFDPTEEGLIYYVDASGESKALKTNNMVNAIVSRATSSISSGRTLDYANMETFTTLKGSVNHVTVTKTLSNDSVVFLHPKSAVSSMNINGNNIKNYPTMCFLYANQTDQYIIGFSLPKNTEFSVVDVAEASGGSGSVTGAIIPYA